MSPLEQRLFDYLPDPNSVKGGLAGVVDLLSVEAPLVVEEILQWHVMYNLVWFITSTAFIFILLFWLVWSWKRIRIWVKAIKKENPTDVNAGSGVYVCGTILPIIALVVCAGMALSHLSWLKPLYCPRLFLLEYLKGMM